VTHRHRITSRKQRRALRTTHAHATGQPIRVTASTIRMANAAVKAIVPVHNGVPTAKQTVHAARGDLQA
ncbi:MAG: hypothetical protein ACREMY_04455, partial [bacterium]